MTGAGLTSTQPLPPAVGLPDDFDRHQPVIEDERAVLLDLAGSERWAELAWSDLIERLLAIGRTDIPLARLAEGHIDSARILGQASAVPAPGCLYGVWASRSQQTGLQAVPVDEGWQLRGTLRFASGAGLVHRALIPVWLDEHHHVLLDVDVADLPYDASVWRTDAMRASRTFELTVDDLLVKEEARVGSVDFYLARPEFFPGGVGVAACWTGGAARLLDLLHARHLQPSPAQQLRLGRMRSDLVAATAVVRATAQALDDVPLSQLDPHLVATEARSVVAEAVRRMIGEARLITGPAGVALDDGIGHAIADLELYVLQQSSDGDAAVLGDPRRRV